MGYIIGEISSVESDEDCNRLKVVASKIEIITIQTNKRFLTNESFKQGT